MHVMHYFAHRQQISDTDTIMCAWSHQARLDFILAAILFLRFVARFLPCDFLFSPISTPIKQITTAPSTVSNLTDIESCGRQHSASVFTVPVIIEAIVKIPKYDKHIIAARGAEPREFLPARYPHDAEEAAKANIAKGSIPDAGSGIFKQTAAPSAAIAAAAKKESNTTNTELIILCFIWIPLSFAFKHNFIRYKLHPAIYRIIS